MYKKINDMFGNEAYMIYRLADGMFIPFDPANRDYKEYLLWVEEGNEPLPADPAEPLPADA